MRKDIIEIDTYTGKVRRIHSPNINQQKPKERWEWLRELEKVAPSETMPSRPAWRKGFDQKIPDDTSNKWKSYFLDIDFISKH